MDVDYASVSAHKLHGPKGIGCLYRRSGAPLEPVLFGGGQECGLRSGTENVPGIIGFGAAARVALRHLEEAGRVRRLRDSFESSLAQAIDGVTVHSGAAERIPNTSNLAFSGCTAEALMLLLEPAGLLCSAGSACHTVQPMPSHVLTAMGLSDGEVRSSLRFPCLSPQQRMRCGRPCSWWRRLSGKCAASSLPVPVPCLFTGRERETA